MRSPLPERIFALRAARRSTFPPGEGSKITLGILVASLAVPASAADTVPDLSGFWGRGTFDFERLPAAPPPIGNLHRLPSGSSDPTRPAGDYNNPILKPEAAAIVKTRAEKALNGVTFPDPSTRCAPYNPPFVAAMQL